MQFHPLANIFPLIEGQAFDDLCADIRAHGVREPVWLYEGQILDGRNRWRAATAVGVECSTRAYVGDDPAGFVVSLNLHRRHLDEAQRGMVAARLANMKVGGDRVSDHSANLLNGRISQSDAAELLNVSTRTVTAAANVINKAPEEIIKAVDRGLVSVSLASQVAALPEDQKQSAADAVQAQPENARDVLREIVRNHRAIGAGENEWYTPAEYAEMARAVMGSIDLDPASCDEANEVIKADAYYTKDDDGLSKDWHGNVWCNPPYSRDLMPAFVEKLKNSFASGQVRQAILVSHNNTDTAWFHSLASVASAICFPKKRIRFYRGDDIAAPTNGQAFFYLGAQTEAFKDAFCGVGFVVAPI
jgi:phage N-6-adenine-methyltransferase